MKKRSIPRVVTVDKTDDGVIIEFDDGRCAIYSASLLHEVFPKAKSVSVAYPPPVESG